MMDVILCTKNQGKVKEFKEIFDLYNLDINLISLSSLNDNDDVDENGKDFKENAYLKASFYHNKYHLPVLSDDSGLCIEALGGEPGINSARYSGLGPEENIKKVLKELENIKNRDAYFICHLCFIDKDNIPHYFVGKVEGKIDTKKSGHEGFGYDPIFLVNYNNSFISMASIEAKDKNKLSHRYHAIIEFIKWYKANY